MQVSKAEYVEHGSEALTAKLARDLEAQGRKPYVVPVGGSNALGCWGYMMAMEEIMQQSQQQGAKFTHIVMACGSGATTAGIALANRLSGYDAKVIGYGVCDDEDYFYDFLDALLSGLGATEKARDIVRMRQSKGAGYALSRCDLSFDAQATTCSDADGGCLESTGSARHVCKHYFVMYVV